MPAVNNNAIKLSQMLDLDMNQANKLYDLMPLSDLAAMTVALNTNDKTTVFQIYNKYKSQIDQLADPQDVNNYYNEQLQISSDHNEAVASTADFFGITGEDVESMIQSDDTSEEPFIPDAQVKEAYQNVLEMMQGMPSRKKICELSMFQRRMLYGLVPDVVSKVMQKTLDMTPIAIMQKHAKMRGLGESAMLENELSLSEMLEKIIEDFLNKIDCEDKEEEKPDTDSHEDKEEDECEDGEEKAKTKSLIDSIVNKRF